MTNSLITFDALNEYFRDYKGALDTDSLYFRIYSQIDIVWRHEKDSNGKSRLHNMMNSSSRTHSIVWTAFLDFANQAVRNYADDSGRTVNYTVTSEQLKKYIAYYKHDYKTLLEPLVKDVEDLRKAEISSQ